MKPFFMQWKQGAQTIAINMNQVCHIMQTADKSMMTFGAIIDNEPSWLCVDESYDEVMSRIYGATR